ncbi:Heat shock protein [Musa troglodytarum]|uniref:Heat shock protein n=1 Tax=Musa troglodytarum TaxID=320322 RepID=A0A9E7JPS7_9LILI|nr:Heat shock protein [Musa troglodytarum]
MRTGSCSVQQGLTPEAASVVRQAVNLARRRGHTQVTPLHVANTMLSSPAGLLRAACLRSHSHPLRCKALELCFNVALNRLPASAPYHARHHLPSLSNALVAAFKRAQANHRRGCVEAQQPALLAVKIELEQLVVSILDDPSVSRVMREAGFCSTQVKGNVEQSICTDTRVATPPQASTTKPAAPAAKDDDIASVVEALVSTGRRRSLVVVGECSDTIDAVVRGVIDRVDRGEVPAALRNSEFITLPLFSFRHMSREEVDQKVAELRCLLRRCCVGRGVVLYLGNLTWISQEKGASPFCPVEHVVMEISSLVCEVESSSRRLWLMGTATYQTYMRCKMGRPSLETLWGLQPLTIPSDSLGLSLKCESGHHAVAPILPSWLQQCKEENRRSGDDQSCCMLEDPCRGWRSALKSRHRPSDLTFNFSSPSPCDSSSSSISSYHQCPPSMHRSQQHSPPPLEVTDPCKGYRLRSSESTEQGFEHDSRSRIPYVNLDSNPNSSAASSSTMEMEYVPKFKELNAENLKILCSALEKKVPWQQEIIPEIASSILRCRAGMTKRKERSRSNYENKEDTWLLFQGDDSEAKKRVAKEVASLIFCSKNNFVSIGLSSISSPRSNAKKRSREDASHGHLERLYEAINENPHRVIFIEDTEQADHRTRAGMKSVIEGGRVCGHGGEAVGVSDAIIILSCRSSKSDDEKEVKPRLPLDLNHCASDDDGGVDGVGLPEVVDRTFRFELPEDL